MFVSNLYKSFCFSLTLTIAKRSLDEQTQSVSTTNTGSK